MPAHSIALIPLIFCMVLVMTRTMSSTIFTLFILVEGLIQLSALIMALSAIPNLWLMHFYTPSTTLLLLAFYYKLHQNLINKWLFRSVFIGALIFSLIEVLLLDSFSKFSSLGLTVRSCLLLICALSTSILLLEDEVQKDKRAVLTSLHWINSGILIYHASSLLILYFGAYIIYVMPNAFSATWSLHALFSFVMYVCFLIGLWKSPKR